MKLIVRFDIKIMVQYKVEREMKETTNSALIETTVSLPLVLVPSPILNIFWLRSTIISSKI